MLCGRRTVDKEHFKETMFCYRWLYHDRLLILSRPVPRQAMVEVYGRGTVLNGYM